VLKGGVKIFKRLLVNEVVGLLLTEFFPDPAHKGATPIQRWTLKQPSRLHLGSQTDPT
jgi:hypothetical protein